MFIHPDDETKVIKIERNEKAESLRSLLGIFRPVPSGNDREVAEYQRLILTNVDYERYFPRFHGVVDTDLGKGVCVQLLKGTDGKLPLSIKEHLLSKVPPPREFFSWFREEYRKFASFCERHLIMSVSSGFENLGIVQVEGARKLVSFDLKSVSTKQLIPLADFSSSLKRQRIRRRFCRQMEKLDALQRL